MNIQEIQPEAVQSQHHSGKKNIIIDVRSPAEFSARHIVGAINIPLDTVSADNIRALAEGASQICVVCEGGGRAKRACEQLTTQGLHNVASIAGGTRGWAEKGFPVELGSSQVISLERQVRIAAGSLVLVGVFGSLALSPAWIWLSGFVGAGLIFAGVTDFCGMALILSRAPWNQKVKSLREISGAPQK